MDPRAHCHDRDGNRWRLQALYCPASQSTGKVSQGQSVRDTVRDLGVAGDKAL